MWPRLTPRRRGGVTVHVPKCGGEQDSLVTTEGVYHSGSTVYFFLITFPRLLGVKTGREASSSHDIRVQAHPDDRVVEK